MEAENLHIIQTYIKTPSLNTTPPQTIKMEDLTAASPSPDSLLDIPSVDKDNSTPKQPRKRKSWGQVLPEPKTNLPPRKRAKTADEKEQRRIERVKRNRLAAHNSRERKRQEVEALQIRNSELEQRMEEMENQLAAYRQLLPGADVPAIKTEHPAPLPILTFLDEISTDAKPDVPPSQSSFESPASLLTTLDSPVDTAPSTPGSDDLMVDESDRTQHSAAMLFDLPCRSDSHLSISSTAAPLNWLTFLILFNFKIILTTAMSKLSSTSTSFHPAIHSRAPNASSTKASKARLSHPTSLPTQMTHWTRLMAASSICSPAQARLLQSATRPALRRRALATKQLQSASGFGAGLEMVAGLRRRRQVSVDGSYSCKTSLVRDIKRRCKIIDSMMMRSSSASGRQKEPLRFQWR